MKIVEVPAWRLSNGRLVVWISPGWWGIRVESAGIREIIDLSKSLRYKIRLMGNPAPTFILSLLAVAIQRRAHGARPWDALELRAALAASKYECRLAHLLVGQDGDSVARQLSEDRFQFSEVRP